MNERPSLFKILWWSFCLGTLLSTLLYTVSTLFFYDPTENYFIYNSLLPKISAILTCLSVLIGSLAALITSKEKTKGSPLFGRIVPTITLPAYLLVLPSLILSPTTNISTLLGLTLIAVGVAAVYSLCLWIPQAVQKHATTLAGLGLFALLACLLLDACLYFDVSVEMNAPIKLLLQIAVLCAMIYYTGELRYLLGKPMPRVFVMMCTWVIATGFPAAVTVILAYLTGKLERLDYFAIGLLALCAAITALIRLHTLFKPQPTGLEIPSEHSKDPQNDQTASASNQTPGDSNNETGKDLT